MNCTSNDKLQTPNFKLRFETQTHFEQKINRQPAIRVVSKYAVASRVFYVVYRSPLSVFESQRRTVCRAISGFAIAARVSVLF